MCFYRFTRTRELSRLGVAPEGAVVEAARASELRSYLEAFIIDTCERFDRDASAREMATILNLRQTGNLWIFTTNYDRIVEHACEQNAVELADGFHNPLGEPVADWDGKFESPIRLVKLHGSVNWYQDNPGLGLHRLDRGYSLPSRQFALVREGQRLTPLMIIPTLEKQVLSRPYADLTVQFTDVIRDLPVLIVAGNSLRDQHLLNYVRYRLPRLQVLLVGPRASQLASRLQLGPSVHAVDVGFREWLVASAAELLALGHELNQVVTPDAVSAAVQRFARNVSTAAESDVFIKMNPDLAAHVKALAASSIADRARAAAALGEHLHPAIVRRLIAVLRDDGEEFVRAAAASALVRLGTADAIAAVGLALKDQSATVQMEAVIALLSRISDPSIRTLLASAVPSLGGPARRVATAELNSSEISAGLV